MFVKPYFNNPCSRVFRHSIILTVTKSTWHNKLPNFFYKPLHGFCLKFDILLPQTLLGISRQFQFSVIDPTVLTTITDCFIYITEVRKLLRNSI
jgi:hypothetical protein